MSAVPIGMRRSKFRKTPSRSNASETTIRITSASAEAAATPFRPARSFNTAPTSTLRNAAHSNPKVTRHLNASFSIPLVSRLSTFTNQSLREFVRVKLYHRDQYCSLGGGGDGHICLISKKIDGPTPG